MKKNRLMKLIAYISTAAISVSAMVLPASAADVYSDTHYYSLWGQAGKWKVEPTHTLQSSQEQVCGGDTGVWFYSTNVGLAPSFVQSTSRKAYIHYYEDDSDTLGHHNNDNLVKKYTATFSITGTEKYNRPYYFEETYNAGKTIIEYSGDLVLYIKIKVESLSDDLSTYIPNGLIKYRYWSYH